MKYQTQKVAPLYFYGALGLFIDDKDVAAFQEALATAHDTYAA